MSAGGELHRAEVWVPLAAELQAPRSKRLARRRRTSANKRSSLKRTPAEKHPPHLILRSGAGKDAHGCCHSTFGRCAGDEPCMRRPLRILFIATDLSTGGGVNKVIRDLAALFRQRLGAEVSV